MSVRATTVQADSFSVHQARRMMHLFDVCEPCLEAEGGHRSLCGTQLPPSASVSYGPVDCVVCCELAPVTPCPRCGVLPS